MSFIDQIAARRDNPLAGLKTTPNASPELQPKIEDGSLLCLLTSALNDMKTKGRFSVCDDSEDSYWSEDEYST